MPDNKKLIKKRPIAKQLKLICSEELIKEIALPLVNFTSYCLSIEKCNELPQIKTMLDSLISAKRQLAMLMASKLGFAINSGELNSIVLETVSHAGYFKLSVIYGTGFTAQRYNVKITGTVDQPLIMKITSVAKTLNPNATIEEISKYATEITKNL